MDLNMWRWFLLFVTPVALSAEMGVDEFMADIHQAEWAFSGTPMVCSLRHEIPGYGTASFEQRAGKPLGFSIEAVKRNPNEAKALLKEMPPAWIHGARTAEPVEITLTRGRTPVRADTEQSEWLLDTLKRGWGCAVEHDDWRLKNRRARAVVSPVNFQKSFSEFQECVSGLLPYTLEDVRFKEFRYRSGQMQPSLSMKQELDKIARYVNASPDNYIVHIHGHTDNIGRRSSNRKVSDKRARQVADYLASQGVSADRLKVKAYGESRPKVSNRTAKGRAANRRVEVRLIMGGKTASKKR
ncbi:MAG: OmpA family protein [Sedimenticola sp.]